MAIMPRKVCSTSCTTALFVASPTNPYRRDTTPPSQDTHQRSQMTHMSALASLGHHR
jgi:hypothetical protein